MSILFGIPDSDSEERPDTPDSNLQLIDKKVTDILKDYNFKYDRKLEIVYQSWHYNRDNGISFTVKFILNPEKDRVEFTDPDTIEKRWENLMAGAEEGADTFKSTNLLSEAISEFERTEWSGVGEPKWVCDAEVMAIAPLITSLIRTLTDRTH